MRIVIGLALLLVWIAVWYSRRPRTSSASATKAIGLKQIFKILFCVFVVLGALGGEIAYKYYSSPTPEPQLGRTVAFEVSQGGTFYVAPEANNLFRAWFAVCAITLAAWVFWPTTGNGNDAKGRWSERRFEPSVANSKSCAGEPVCDDVADPSGSPTQCVLPGVLDQSERLDTPPGMFAYYWQPRKLNRYAFTVIAFGMAAYIWIDPRFGFNWWPRLVIAGVALWSLRMLIDYRTSIDRESGTFTRERLLLGRYPVGGLRLPLTEFASVALDRYEDSEDSSRTFYVCLRQRTGRLMQICYFRVRNGQRSEDAEKAARELAEITGLQYENAA